MALDYNCPVCNREIGYEGLCWKCKSEKERNEALNLTDNQIAERQNYLVEHLHELENSDNPAYKYFWDCLSYHNVISENLQRMAVERKIFTPSEIYYHAPEDVRDKLIEYLMATENSQEASNILCCLAMQGDNKVLETFYELKKNPKSWRKDLYVDTDIYAYDGGWTFDKSGKRQLINYNRCYSIEKKNSSDKAITIGKLRDDTCPHCSGRLVDILSVDGKDKRLSFLEVDGTVTATCCPSCVMYTSHAYSRFELDGKSSACFPYDSLSENEENYMESKDYDNLLNNGMVLSEKEKLLFYGADDWEISTIGGFAHWIQDCNITMCPDCGKPMRYMAQLSWESIMNDYLEGTLYIEICPDCKVTSMHHQQT